MNLNSKVLFNSLFSSSLTALIIIIGVLGSIWSTEIIKYFPFTKSIEYSSWVILFWLLLIVCLTLFFFRQISTEKEKYISINKLHEAIRTIPPPDFLTLFRSLYEEVSYLTSALIKNPNSKADDIIFVIKYNLLTLISLIEKFDNKDDKKTNYGANIMVFRPSNLLDSDEITSIQEYLLFTEPELNIKSLDGLLELFPELSVSSNTQNFKDDLDVPKIALPIPKDKQSILSNSKALWRILPGAPFSFVTNSPNTFSDVSEIKDWCDNNGDFTKNITKQINKYFLVDNIHYMKSFVSLPFPRQKDTIQGVINIHCNLKGMLESEEQLKQFSDIVKPIVCNIFELVNFLFIEPNLE